MDTLCKQIFHLPRSHTCREKCDDNLKLASHFSPILFDRWAWNFFCILTHMDTLCKPNQFQGIIAFFSKSVRPRNMKFGLQRVCIWVNIQKKFQVPRSHSIGQKCDANFKLSSHFSQKMCNRGTWNLVFKEYPYGLIYKKNLNLLGRTVSEKNAMLTCKISKLFIRTIVQLRNFARYHRIFLEKCATEEHEIWFAKSIHMGQYTKKISSLSVAQYWRKVRC